MVQYYILGNGGFANELYDQVFLQNRLEDFGGFITLKSDKALLVSDKGITNFIYPVDAKFLIGTGNKKWRSKFLLHFLDRYRETEEHFPNIAVNSAHISKMADIGIGNIFCAFSMVNADVVIGDFNLVNTYSMLSHGTKIGSYNIFCPKSSTMGEVRIKDFNFFGTGVTIVPNIKIGSHNALSAGEYLFENMGNKQFFQSGIVVDKK